MTVEIKEVYLVSQVENPDELNMVLSRIAARLDMFEGYRGTSPFMPALDPGGLGSSTDNAIARFDGTTGKLQNSLTTISDPGTENIPWGQTYNIGGVPHEHSVDDLFYPVSFFPAGYFPEHWFPASFFASGETPLDFTNLKPFIIAMAVSL